ncbi:MAG: 7-cyano-7-deazaguanine synthase QueC [Candidatus Margulisiibacteriota bacterium]|jgi:7-cyano-7-deazaguanine synthase
MTKPKALVLLSGGQDSTTCLAIALKAFPNQVEAIGFNYGQRHLAELKAAEKIARIAQIPFKVLDLSLLGQITHNALTSKEIKIEQNQGQLPSTFVDGRNMVFLLFAAIYAKNKNIKNIYIGACQTDYSGYPDCRDEFIKSANQTLNLAMDYEFKIITPLMWLTKAEEIKLMQLLGNLAWYQHTLTCYEGINPPCGICPACKLRAKGFQEANISDPLLINSNKF